MHHRSGIAMVGFMGAGKSAVGLALARKLCWPFVDLDEQIVERFGPISALIASRGIEYFRAREREIALSLCDGAVRVLATGGGTLLDLEVRRTLPLCYRLVFLDVPLDVARARVGGDPGRPLWDEHVAVRYEERQAIYRLAEMHVDAMQPVCKLTETIASMMMDPSCR